MTVIQTPIAGQITTAGPSSLTDTNQSWASDIWIGYNLYIVAGRGAGQSAVIASNNSSTITIQGTWVTEPDHSSYYQISLPKPNVSHTNILRFSNMTVTAGDVYPYAFTGTQPTMPFDGTLLIDIYSSVAQNVETIMGSGTGSAKSYFASLAAGTYYHLELELAEGDGIYFYFSADATIALSLGAKQ